MNITKVKVRNYRSLHSCDIDFNSGLNIVVGDNEAGKSTLIEAIALSLTGYINGRPISSEIHPFLFSISAIQSYVEAIRNGKPAPLPAITIELFFNNIPELADFRGNDHSEAPNDLPGIRFSIEFNEAHRAAYEHYISTPANIQSIPVEYYHPVFWAFSRKPLVPRAIPISPVIVDASRITTITGANRYVTGLVREALPDQEQVRLSVAYRKLQETFLGDDSIKDINKKLATHKGTISDKTLSMTLDPTVRGGWESGIMPSLDDVPITLVGKGEQNAVKIKLALENSSDAHVFLIEEPENHLSYPRLNKLINAITQKAGNRQLIITTHSSFVLNKLGLNNVILFKDGRSARLNDLSKGTYEYFQKLPGHDTLRVLLSQKSILVEGPSDELVVLKAFFVKHGVSPLEKGVDVISVKALAFKRFLEIAKLLKLKSAVVTDNDGDTEALEKKYEDYSEIDHISIHYDKDIAYKTLEPQMLKANDRDIINKILNTEFKTDEELIAYMTKPANKTDVALAFFETTEPFAFPDYINDAVE